MHGHAACILNYARDYARDYARPAQRGLEPLEPTDGRLYHYARPSLSFINQLPKGLKTMIIAEVSMTFCKTEGTLSFINRPPEGLKSI